MTTNAPTDPAAAIAARTAPPFARWYQRQIEEDAPRGAVQAAILLYQHGHAAAAIALTVAPPGAFTAAQRLELAARVAEAREAMTPEGAELFAAGMPSPGGLTPLDRWAQARRAQGVAADELAAARVAFERLCGAASVAREHFRAPVDAPALLGLYDALGPSEATGEPVERAALLADLACADAIADTLLPPRPAEGGRPAFAGFAPRDRVALLEHLAVARLDIIPESVEPIAAPDDVSKPFDAWLARQASTNRPAIEAAAAAMVMQTLRGNVAMGRELAVGELTAAWIIEAYVLVCQQEAAMVARADAAEGGDGPGGADDENPAGGGA